jgi:hypothetical protein
MMIVVTRKSRHSNVEPKRSAAARISSDNDKTIILLVFIDIYLLSNRRATFTLIMQSLPGQGLSPATWQLLPAQSYRERNQLVVVSIDVRELARREL